MHAYACVCTGHFFFYARAYDRAYVFRVRARVCSYICMYVICVCVCARACARMYVFIRMQMVERGCSLHRAGEPWEQAGVI